MARGEKKSGSMAASIDQQAGDDIGPASAWGSETNAQRETIDRARLPVKMGHVKEREHVSPDKPT